MPAGSGRATPPVPSRSAATASDPERRHRAGRIASRSACRLPPVPETRTTSRAAARRPTGRRSPAQRARVADHDDAAPRGQLEERCRRTSAAAPERPADAGGTGRPTHRRRGPRPPRSGRSSVHADGRHRQLGAQPGQPGHRGEGPASDERCRPPTTTSTTRRVNRGSGPGCGRRREHRDHRQQAAARRRTRSPRRPVDDRGSPGPPGSDTAQHARGCRARATARATSTAAAEAGRAELGVRWPATPGP